MMNLNFNYVGDNAMKTQEYATKLAAKNTFVAELKIVTERLIDVRTRKREAVAAGDKETPLKAEYLQIKKIQNEMFAKLDAMNEELKQMRETGSNVVQREPQKRGRKPGAKVTAKAVELSTLADLKKYLESHHVAFVNKGIMLMVKDKRVMCNKGKFTVDGNVIPAEKVISAL